MKSMIGLVLASVAFAALYTQFYPQPVRVQTVQHAEDPGVTESEVELYISVYKAMQSDHGLTIDKALEPHGMAVDKFRSLERRVQKEPRQVERVRKELLEYARSRGSAPVEPPDGEAPTPAEP